MNKLYQTNLFVLLIVSYKIKETWWNAGFYLPHYSCL